MAAVEKTVNQDNYCISETLFTNADTGHSLKFSMTPCPKRTLLQPLVERGGGTIQSKRMKDTIRLLGPGQTAQSREVYSYKYILDCIKQQKLLNISKYSVRLNKTVVDSADDSFGSERDTTVKVRRQDRCGRSRYDRSEDIAILHKLLEQDRHLNVGGNKVWKELEQLKVTNHTWQSMKDHYWKFILPNIDKHDLDANQKQMLTKSANQKDNKDSDTRTSSRSSPNSHAVRSPLIQNTLQVCPLRCGTGSSGRTSKTASTVFESPTSTISDTDELDRELLAHVAAHGSDGKHTKRGTTLTDKVQTPEKRGRPPKKHLHSPESSSTGNVSAKATDDSAEVHTPRKRGRPPKEQLDSPEIPFSKDRRQNQSTSDISLPSPLHKRSKPVGSSGKSPSDANETDVEKEVSVETAVCPPKSPFKKLVEKSVAVIEGDVRETRSLAKLHISDQPTGAVHSKETVELDDVLSRKRVCNGSASPEKRFKLSKNSQACCRGNQEVAVTAETFKQSSESPAQMVDKTTAVGQSHSSPLKGHSGDGSACQHGRGRNSSGQLHILRDVVLNDISSQASSVDIMNTGQCEVETQGASELENYVQLTKQIAECLHISARDFMQAVCLFSGSVDDAVSWILTGNARSGKPAWNAADDDQRLFHADESDYEVLVDKYGEEVVQGRLRFLTTVSQFTVE